GGGRERVDAARERARRDGGAGAEDAVTARGPGEAAREVAVLEVERDGREGQGVAGARDRHVGRAEDDDLRPGGDVQVDLRAAGQGAAVRGGGGDDVRADRERARAEARARPERAVAVGRPADAGAEVAVDRVGGGRGEGRGLGEEDLGIVRRGRDRHGRRRLVADLEGDLGHARQVGEVGGPGGDRVHADREAADREARAAADRPVAIGGPGDRRRPIAVDRVAGGRREGDRLPVREERAGWRSDRHHRRGVVEDGDVRRGAGREAGRVGDRRGQGVRAAAERPAVEAAARADRAVAVGGPQDARREVAVEAVGGGGGEGYGRAEGELLAVGRGGQGEDRRRDVGDVDGDLRAAGEAARVGGARRDRVVAEAQVRAAERAARADLAVAVRRPDHGAGAVTVD